jgi:Abi-like protein
MPNSPDDEQRLKKFISPERLRAFVEMTASDKKAIELHQDSLRLSSALMVAIATIEIALRNSICENLTQHFGVSTWLTQPPVPFQWKKPELDKVNMALDSAKRSEYAKLSQTEKHKLEDLAFPNGRPNKTTHLARSKARRKLIPVSEGKVIAELTFYFWKRLFSSEYEQSLWRTTLKRTFPFKALSRSVVAVNLEQIYQTRNRLAHHEPVLGRRFEDALLAIEFVAQHLEAQTPSTHSPLAMLLMPDILEVKHLHHQFQAKLDHYKVVKHGT